MAHVYDSRSTGDSFTSSPNILRVACIGDSLMWGAGVTARECLPNHLLRFLNSALLFHLVWVDNFGQSSGNLWHSWANFKACAKSRRFESVIFSVCQNDSALFESNSVKYDSDKVPYWGKGTTYYSQVRKLFADVSQFTTAAGTIPIVLFYSVLEGDIPIIAEVAGICAELNLPFVDVYSYYKQQTAIRADTYAASAVDGHPSNFAHELVARHVSHILARRSGEFSSKKTYTYPFVDSVRAALADLLEQGVTPDYMFSWMTSVLNYKARSFKRQLDADSINIARIHEEMAAQLVLAQRDWRTKERIHSLRLNATLPENLRPVVIPNIYAHTRNLDEAVFLLATSSVDELVDLGRLFGPERSADNFFLRDGRLDFYSNDFSAELSKLKLKFEGLKVFRPDLIRRSTKNDLLDHALRRRLYCGLDDPDLNSIWLQVERLWDHLYSLEEIERSGKLATQVKEVQRLVAIVFASFYSVVSYVVMVEDCIAAASIYDSLNPAPITCVDFVVSSDVNAYSEGSLHPCQIAVEIDYVVPIRARSRFALWVPLRKGRASYHVELPLMLSGRVKVMVEAHDPLQARFSEGVSRFERVDVYNPASELLPEPGSCNSLCYGGAVDTQAISDKRYLFCWQDASFKGSEVQLDSVLLM